MEATGPNAEQIEYWNKQAGPKWVAEVTRMDALITPLGQLALEAAQPRPGERVLDVGCGTGQTSVQLVAKVGPGGSVSGVDISTPMLEWARKRVRDAGLSNVQFENADAQTHALPASHFDLCFSRFGVMFFIDPVAAFKNLARALKPGGRVAFVCWQPFLQNAWVREPMLAISKVVQLPPPPPPGTPGPFAFGESERTRGILEQAGFADVSLAGKTAQLKLGQTVDEASAFAIEIGPVGAQLRDAPESIRRNAAAAIRDALAPHAGPQGVALGCAVWIATGTRK
jgi:SAM-dependent methyltransferase